MSGKAKQDEPVVTIWVSDPWSVPDENDGRLGFVARIVGNANGELLLRLTRPVRYEGAVWNFAIPAARYEGQHFLDEFERGMFGTSANIQFSY